MMFAAQASATLHRWGRREHEDRRLVIEIERANQSRVSGGFSALFFALTEHEIMAAEQLGSRHRVARFNAQADAIQMTSVGAILERARSMTWQVSVQL